MGNPVVLGELIEEISSSSTKQGFQAGGRVIQTRMNDSGIAAGHAHSRFCACLHPGYFSLRMAKSIGQSTANDAGTDDKNLEINRSLRQSYTSGRSFLEDSQKRMRLIGMQLSPTFLSQPNLDGLAVDDKAGDVVTGFVKRMTASLTATDHDGLRL